MFNATLVIVYLLALNNFILASTLVKKPYRPQKLKHQFGIVLTLFAHSFLGISGLGCHRRENN